MAHPPISTRNAAIVCVRGEPPGPMVVTFPSAPAAPYSRVTTGVSGSVENMLNTPYDRAPSAPRRVQRTSRCMRSYKSTNSEPASEPDLSSSMNGMPVFTILYVECGITWNHKSRRMKNADFCTHENGKAGQREVRKWGNVSW